MPKLLNYRRVKIHRSYTVEDVARLYGVHKNTVREWLRTGLSVCNERRPILILGSDLAEFLRKRRNARRCKCGPGLMYCLRCRSPQLPAEGMADYVATSPTLGNLIGLCPRCNAVMNRRVNPLKLGDVRGTLDVRVMEGFRDLDESANPSVNSDLIHQKTS